MNEQPKKLAVQLKPIKPVRIELPHELFPKIISSKDVKVGDEIIPEEEACSGNIQGRRWTVVGIKEDHLFVEEKRLFMTSVYPLDLEKVRLNPFGLYL